MKNIDCSTISETVKKLCIHSNYYLSDDLKSSLNDALQTEKSEIGINILNQIINNAEIAKNEKMAMCQDTGMTVVFVELGQDVVITGGTLTDAINKGVALGYNDGFLRKSVVNDPLIRENTGDNTPAIIHYDIVPGDNLKITVSPKGFGSENMSALKMLKPSDGVEGVKAFIVETVDKAGPNPCPPIIVGVGLGGTMEKAAILAKKALLRPMNEKSNLNHIKALEEELLKTINNLGIGPGGLGGNVTALSVNIETYPTHIAGLPVAVNICCHALRHSEHVF
jgi:fumarate hydratase subunit alpha